jgi:hypothetical protein
MVTVVDNLSGNSAEATAADTSGFVARARWLMLISALTTAIAIAAVVGVIGYRVFHTGGSVTAAADGIVMLPKGARIVSTAVAADRLVVTLDVAGVTELRVFDLGSLKQTGRLQFATEP